MNRGAVRVMILARRVPWLAQLIVASVVAVDRFRPGGPCSGAC
jgi:hypothetical protein